MPEPFLASFSHTDLQVDARVQPRLEGRGVAKRDHRGFDVRVGPVSASASRSLGVDRGFAPAVATLT